MAYSDTNIKMTLDNIGFRYHYSYVSFRVFKFLSDCAVVYTANLTHMYHA